MPEVNLLPENLRERESAEKQKSARARRHFEVAYTRPDDSHKSLNLAAGAKNESFFSRLFGRPVSPVVSPKPASNIKLNIAVLKPAIDLQANAEKPKAESFQPAKSLPRPPISKARADLPLLPAPPAEPFWSLRFAAEMIAGVFKKFQFILPISTKKPSSKPVQQKLNPKVPAAAKDQPAIKPAAEAKLAGKKIKPTKSGGWLSWLFANEVKPVRSGKFDLSGLEVMSSVPKFSPSLQEQAKAQPQKEQPIDIPMPQAKEILTPKAELPKAEPIKQEETSEHLEKNLSVNLLPISLAAQNQIRQNRSIIGFSLATLFPLTLLIAAYIFIGTLISGVDSQIAVNQKELDKNNSQIKQLQTAVDSGSAEAYRLAALEKVMSQRPSWTKFFALLEKYTLDGVYYTNFQADTGGIIQMPGVADNYEVLAEQLALFRDHKDFVKAFKVGNISAKTDQKTGVAGVNFQVQLSLSSNVFSMQTTSPVSMNVQ